MRRTQSRRPFTVSLDATRCPSSDLRRQDSRVLLAVGQQHLVLRVQAVVMVLTFSAFWASPECSASSHSWVPEPAVLVLAWRNCRCFVLGCFTRIKKSDDDSDFADYDVDRSPPNHIRDIIAENKARTAKPYDGTSPARLP